ncbi:MAG: sugar ABC transporter substrate-binding protein [bacterium]|nr:sugar ABC transporter substrate-binding protein [bacterium]
MVKRYFFGVLVVMLMVSGSVFASDEKIVLNYLFLTAADMVTELSVIEEYNAMQDKVEIHPIHVEFSELDKQILLSATSGGASDYDIMMTNHSSVPQFVSAGVLEPLDDFIASAGIDLSSYQQAAVSIGEIDGIQYAIPYNPDCRVLVYNKAMLADIGMDVPQTTGDLLKIGAELIKKEIYAFAGDYNKNWFPIYDFGCFMLGNGGHIYELHDGKYVATADSQAVIDFVKWSVEMYQYMPHDYSIQDSMVRELVFQNKVAMMWFGPWEFKFFQEYLDQDKFGLALMPKGTKKSGSSMGGWMLSINSKSAHKEAAKEFLAYVNTPEKMAKMAHALPADSKSFDYPPFNDPKYQIFSEQFKTAEYPAPPTPVYPLAAEIFNSYYQKALTGAMSPEEACKKANEEIQRELDNM